jgi:hypothetical protein
MAVSRQSSAHNHALNTNGVTLTLPAGIAGDMWAMTVVAYDDGATATKLVQHAGDATFVLTETGQIGTTGLFYWSGYKYREILDTDAGFQLQDGTDTVVNAKYLRVYATLLRSGNTDAWIRVKSAGNGGGASSAATNNSVSIGGTAAAGDFTQVNLINDDKETAFSDIRFGTAGSALTEEFELSLGSGPPANWSSGSAGYIVGSSSSDTTVTFDVDDSGEPWVGAGIVVEEVTPAIEQSDFRFRNDDNDEADATWKAAVNVDIAIPDENTVVRIRHVLKNSGGDFPNGPPNGPQRSSHWQLRYSKNSGSYVNVSSTSPNVQGYDSTNITGNEVTTQQLGGGTFDVGKMAENGISTIEIADVDVLSGRETELEWVVQVIAADVANGDTLDFRIYANPGRLIGAIDTYTEVGRITIQASQTLTGILFTRAPTFPTGAAQPENTLVGILFARAPTFPTGDVLNTQIISGLVFAKAPTFPTGDISLRTLSGALYALAPTFPTGAVSFGGGFIGWGIPIA